MLLNTDIFYFLLGFLIGSIPTGYLLTQSIGDIRKFGSGNIGATNVLRYGGKFLGLLTLLIDSAKGFITIVYFHTYIQGDVSDHTYTIMMGTATILGHIFSPWLKFKGGKGVATMLGVILFISMSCSDSNNYCYGYLWMSIDSNIFFITIFSWLMIIFFTRYVALGSVISLTIATIYSFFYLPDLFLFFALMTLLITYKHKDNFERIKNKTEHKISF